jgi:MFS superfamily sulfate permease-like transporter
METLSYIDYNKNRVEGKSLQTRKTKGTFITPVTMIVALFTTAILITCAFLYFYPVITLAVVLTTAAVLALTVKRKHLTFFDEQYEPDVFVEQIEEEREKKYIRREKSSVA